MWDTTKDWPSKHWFHSLQLLMAVYHRILCADAFNVMAYTETEEVPFASCLQVGLGVGVHSPFAPDPHTKVNDDNMTFIFP